MATKVAVYQFTVTIWDARQNPDDLSAPPIEAPTVTDGETIVKGAFDNVIAKQANGRSPSDYSIGVEGERKDN